MNWDELFLKDDRLRSVWRFFLSLIVLFVALRIGRALLTGIFLLTHAHPTEFTAMFWRSLRALLAILATFKLMTAVFDRRPFASMGLGFHSRWGKELGQGLLIGGTMLLMAVTLEWGCGLAHFTFIPHPVLWPGIGACGLFAVGAVNEEAVFRGYPFQRLVDSITPWGAIAVTSAFFGLAHLGNPHKTWISTINTMLVGVPFAIAYLRTRSLWMPIGMHFIWNFLLDFLLGLPVSGLNLTTSVLTARVQGPVWLTGGDYGPEGGFLATIAILLVTVYVAFAKSIYTSEEMQALVDTPVESRPPEPPISIFSSSSDEKTKRG